MNLCACDPDVKTPAFALFRDRTLAGWHIVKGESPEAWLPDIRKIIHRWQPAKLVIENQYLPKTRDALSRFRSVAQLVSARSMIMAVFMLEGIPSILVEPFAWQQSLGGSQLGRLQLKDLSRLMASSIACKPITNHNVADAINIGHWYLTTQRRSE